MTTPRLRRWLESGALRRHRTSAREVYLDSCRSLRNQTDYDRAGVMSAADVVEIIEETARFRDEVLTWLGEVHPELLAGPGG